MGVVLGEPRIILITSGVEMLFLLSNLLSIGRESGAEIRGCEL